MKGLVFNIQRYSVHDGSGNRTVIFLKGCPLSCPWCANPESRLGVQPGYWLKNGKREVVGKWFEVVDLVEEVMRDEVFFRSSKGGVTLSGGEVLMQHEFARALLKEFHDLGIHTAIETTGCFEKERLESLLPYLDEVLFDLKILDGSISKQVIGLDVERVKENFETALDKTTVIPRIPLIPNYTVTDENLKQLITYLKSLQVTFVHLLPFHQYGRKKYADLGWDYPMKEVETLSEKTLSRIKKMFEREGIGVDVGGL